MIMMSKDSPKASVKKTSAGDGRYEAVKPKKLPEKGRQLHGNLAKQWHLLSEDLTDDALEDEFTYEDDVA
jgi:hypothetical protein